MRHYCGRSHASTAYRGTYRYGYTWANLNACTHGGSYTTTGYRDSNRYSGPVNADARSCTHSNASACCHCRTSNPDAAAVWSDTVANSAVEPARPAANLNACSA